MIRFLRLFLPCLLLAACPAGAGARDITVAVLAIQGADRAAQDFEPTLSHLQRTLPEHRFFLYPLDLTGIATAVAAGQADFLITNPGEYVDLESRFGVTRLATLENRDHAVPTDSVGSTVIAPNRPGAPRTLADLAGKRLAVVSNDAFGGWQAVWREMEDAGISPAALSHLTETGFPMHRIFTALQSGAADAGVIRACLLEEAVAAGRISDGAFTVVAERPTPGFPCRVSSRLYPDWPFARLAGTPPDLAKAVTAALLTMPPAGGRAWTAPQDYTSVHALFRDLKIGPYAGLARPAPWDLLRAHWHWALAAGLGLVWWIIHVARVETLVRRRTAELIRAGQDREKAEQAARLHREERDQFSRLGILGEMASNIAHELNQPLAAISNYAEGITRLIDAGRTDPALLRDGARGIAGQAERAGVILRRIRSFVRRRDTRRERLDLNAVITETLPLFDATARRSGIALHLRLSPGLPPVHADRVELEQVLLNLLQNALDAMADPATHSRGIILSTVDGGDRVELTVRDHGTGLSAEAEAHLFDSFFTTKPQGLGLGLPICRTIIESHGGRLWAANAADGGLTLHISLPYPPADSPEPCR